MSVSAALVGGEFTNAGHAIALLLGVLVGMRFRAPAHWTAIRCLMLLNSAGFGFLILAHSMWGMAAGAVFGVIGALLAYALTCRFTRGPQRDQASDEVSDTRQPALTVNTCE